MRFKAKNKQGIKRKRKRGKRKEMGIKLFLLILFFAVMVGVGFYSRRHVNSVDGFVLGGRSVGPWLTAFAYGTSYFSAVVFVGYAGQFGWKYGIASTWIGIGNALIGFFWTEVWKQIVKNRSIGDCVCVPDPVYSIRL